MESGRSPAVAAAGVRVMVVESFFRAAFANDMYPDEDLERIFGVQMDNGIGSLVFNAWNSVAA